MADLKVYRLIIRLDEKTKNGELKWESTITGGEFQVSFKDYSVGIVEYDNRRTNVIDMHLKIYDSKGELIEVASDTDFQDNPHTPKAYDMFASIYDGARRMALGVDDALDAILSELAP